MSDRKIIWYSCGVSSTIAGLLADKNGTAEWIRIFLPNEDTDSERYLDDCIKRFNLNVQTITANKNVDEVILKRKFINSPFGAPCTSVLKKEVRFAWEKENIKDDDHITYVWGFDVNEAHRAKRMIESYPQFDHEFPLIDNGLTKADCHGIIKALGVKRPRMYDMGFPNNNCIMCVKGGMGSFNLFRQYFPEQFNERAQTERQIGHSCLKKCFLDELPEDAGRKPKTIPQDLTVTGEAALQIINNNLEQKSKGIDYGNLYFNERIACAAGY